MQPSLLGESPPKTSAENAMASVSPTAYPTVVFRGTAIIIVGCDQRPLLVAQPSELVRRLHCLLSARVAMPLQVNPAPIHGLGMRRFCCNGRGGRCKRSEYAGFPHAMSKPVPQPRPPKRASPEASAGSTFVGLLPGGLIAVRPCLVEPIEVLLDLSQRHSRRNCLANRFARWLNVSACSSKSLASSCAIPIQCCNAYYHIHPANSTCSCRPPICDLPGGMAPLEWWLTLRAVDNFAGLVRRQRIRGHFWAHENSGSFASRSA